MTQKLLFFLSALVVLFVSVASSVDTVGARQWFRETVDRAARQRPTTTHHVVTSSNQICTTCANKEQCCGGESCCNNGKFCCANSTTCCSDTS